MGEHDRTAGGVFREGVVLENVVVGIHVVQSVADVMDGVVFDARVIGEGKIDAVARLADVVAANQIAFAVPLVNAVAAAVGDEGGVAVFRALADAFFDRLGRDRSVVLPSMRLPRMRASRTFFR